MNDVRKRCESDVVARERCGRATRECDVKVMWKRDVEMMPKGMPKRCESDWGWYETAVTMFGGTARFSKPSSHPARD